MIIGNDYGTAVTVNRAETWHIVQLPIAQMYHVTVDTAIPYNVLGNRQDGASSRGPSRSEIHRTFRGREMPRFVFHGVGGGESGFATPDPTDPNIVWSSASGSGAGGGIVVRYNETNGRFRHLEVWAAGHHGVARRRAQVPIPMDLPLAHLSPRQQKPSTSPASMFIEPKTTDRAGRSSVRISPRTTSRGRVSPVV